VHPGTYILFAVLRIHGVAHATAIPSMHDKGVKRIWLDPFQVVYLRVQQYSLELLLLLAIAAWSSIVGILAFKARPGLKGWTAGLPSLHL
jgi:hypothetical protein